MRFDHNIHHRRSIRLTGYDYAENGFYFVTICSQNRELLFIESEIKIMIKKWWLELEDKFKQINLDKFVIMPNHLHGIIQINRPGQTHRSAPTLGRMIQWFKTMTTNEYIRNVKTKDWLAFFNGQLWQRNYWEHIIRDEQSLFNIRQYIEDNPKMWCRDRNNPDNL